ncbi:hypothetical protein CVT26_002252 [Gymnopilus dilepis]|uniref:Uncharacterized protein n=1 Tax=Gymnopilus dilepis TaxID=231916 RepID=A0A409YN40_9AGAR|nr:hypothetical protein CVT26_002252 [Gymnopilus dilepis]
MALAPHAVYDVEHTLCVDTSVLSLQVRFANFPPPQPPTSEPREDSRPERARQPTSDCQCLLSSPSDTEDQAPIPPLTSPNIHTLTLAIHTTSMIVINRNTESFRPSSVCQQHQTPCSNANII